jgi:hypothetical protein
VGRGRDEEEKGRRRKEKGRGQKGRRVMRRFHS